METRVALIGIVLKDRHSAERLNGILHEYSDFIIRRMGSTCTDTGAQGDNRA